jgi:hypothetical protein
MTNKYKKIKKIISQKFLSNKQMPLNPFRHRNKVQGPLG